MSAAPEQHAALRQFFSGDPQALAAALDAADLPMGDLDGEGE